MQVNNLSIERLNGRLQEITSAIQKREVVLKQIKKRSTRYTTTSDVGWLLSMFAGETGTLTAVLSGMEARKWDEIARQIEQDILLLRVDQKMKAKELEDALSTLNS